MRKNASVHFSQVYSSAWARHSLRDNSNELRAAVRKSSDKTPVRPFATTSAGPMTGKAAIGNPQAIASSKTRPNVSVKEGKTKASAET